MKKQLTHISPLKAGIVLGVLYGLLSLLVVPFFLLAAVAEVSDGKSGGKDAALFLVALLLFPVLYGAACLIGGIVISAVYNLVAKWTGGLEFEVREIPPAA